jgi:hypothetical protein
LRASLRASISTATLAPRRRDQAQSFARLMTSGSVTRDFKDHAFPMAEERWSVAVAKAMEKEKW